MLSIEVFLTFITSIVTVVIMPIVLLKLNKNQEYNKRVGKERLEIDEAEMKITKYHRIMSREGAEAIRKGKSNGELSKAIMDFDNAFVILEEQKEKAIQKLKNEYK